MIASLNFAKVVYCTNKIASLDFAWEQLLPWLSIHSYESHRWADADILSGDDSSFSLWHFSTTTAMPRGRLPLSAGITGFPLDQYKVHSSSFCAEILEFKWMKDFECFQILSPSGSSLVRLRILDIQDILFSFCFPGLLKLSIIATHWFLKVKQFVTEHIVTIFRKITLKVSSLIWL